MPMEYPVLLLGSFILLSLECVTQQPDGLEEYCEREIFRADCGYDAVVSMLEARYGRMTLGRCLSQDFGFMDCFSDVLPEMDKLCSGRTDCSVPVISLEAEPCPMEFRSYLSASFACIPVVNAGNQCCQLPRGRVLLEADIGYLASSVFRTSTCGNNECTWHIQSLNGQRINLYIYDFGYYNQVSDEQDLDDQCFVYAIIKEVSVGYIGNVCAGIDREKHLYKTSRNTVEVSFIDHGNDVGQQPEFVIEYQALGCGDPTPLKHGTVERNGDHAIMRCLESEDSWDIVCDNGKWSAFHGNCTTGSSQSIDGDRHSNSRWKGLNLNMAVILIVAVTVIISLAILTIGIVCIAKRRSLHQADIRCNEIMQRSHKKTFDGTLRADVFAMDDLLPNCDDNYSKSHNTFNKLPKAVSMSTEFVDTTIHSNCTITRHNPVHLTG